MVLLSFFVLFIILLMPAEAHAWGPAAHLEMGLAIINDAAMLAAPIRAVIVKFPYDFLYGGISADIVVGKNLVEELKHCHNWDVGFKLLKKARNGAQKAFAYGYLSHLAADTVAHNHYIPEMMIRSFSTRILRHIYWELRFDAMSDGAVWQMPKKMVSVIDPGNDRLLDSAFEDTPLSFRTNKRIFSSVLSIQRLNQWHRMLRLVSLASRWKLDKDVRKKYFDASVAAIRDVLIHNHTAACVKTDPTGRHSLGSAKMTRQRLKLLRSGGTEWNKEMEAALEKVRL